jgi:5-methylcytosine-specific restriction endonuclease McrA
MAYLVDEKAAARSRNHQTKVKSAKRAEAKKARRQSRQLAKQSAYMKARSGPVYVRQFAPNAFYDSREWQELRYRVLRKYGATCQCCGATRRDGVRIHVDHIKPRSRFPSLELDENNLQVLCEPCNMGKGAQDLTDWR